MDIFCLGNIPVIMTFEADYDASSDYPPLCCCLFSVNVI